MIFSACKSQYLCYNPHRNERSAVDMAVFVVLHGNQWAVKTDNSERAYRVFDTQAEATQCGIEVAKNNHTELRIQDRDGKFRRCNSYGNDPRSVKDKNW